MRTLTNNKDQCDISSGSTLFAKTTSDVRENNYWKLQPMIIVFSNKLYYVKSLKAHTVYIDTSNAGMFY